MRLPNRRKTTRPRPNVSALPPKPPTVLVRSRLVRAFNEEPTRRSRATSTTLSSRETNMTIHLKHFAMASREDGSVQYISGPHVSRAAAVIDLTTALGELSAKGIEITSAGTFAADYEATSIPAPTVK